MLNKTQRLAIAMVICWIGFGVGSRAEAGGLALSTPAGLSPGDTFRIVFVTDGTTTATSSSIDTYNNFVSSDASTQAGGGSVTYNGTPLAWTAIASTATASANTSIGTTGAPVYLASGTLVAPNDGDIGGAGLLTENLVNPISQDLRGLTISNFVWTGTTSTGQADTVNPLGTTHPLAGLSSSTSSWLEDTPVANTQLFPLYGISQVLTVTAGVAVPEPSSLVMAGTGISAVFAYGWFRRRRDQRRQRPVGQTDAIE